MTKNIKCECQHCRKCLKPPHKQTPTCQRKYTQQRMRWIFREKWYCHHCFAAWLTQNKNARQATPI